MVHELRHILKLLNLLFLLGLHIFRLPLVLDAFGQVFSHVSHVLRDVRSRHSQAVADVLHLKLLIVEDSQLGLGQGREITYIDPDHVSLAAGESCQNSSLALGYSILVDCLSLLLFLDLSL